MSCERLGTADAIPQYCSLCGRVDHGSIACCVVGEEWYPPPITTRVNVTYRVLDDRLFVVDPGSPPPLEN